MSVTRFTVRWEDFWNTKVKCKAWLDETWISGTYICKVCNWLIGWKQKNMDCRVSNSPNAPTGRPEIWFHSLIHAREPESMEQNIYFIYWLFENYNIDPVATYILKNRELYFTLVLNPDGYVYNETTNPSGGGMWRKNRKNFGGTYGSWSEQKLRIVCLLEFIQQRIRYNIIKRYIQRYSAFFRTGNKAVMKFVNSRNFSAILGSVYYGNYLIKPWMGRSYTNSGRLKIQWVSADMTIYNHFTIGTPFQTVGYKVRAPYDDWYYKWFRPFTS